jgi:VWFA-related protein
MSRNPVKTLNTAFMMVVLVFTLLSTSHDAAAAVSVTVKEIDTSDYPLVRLSLDIRDEAGNVIEGVNIGELAIFENDVRAPDLKVEPVYSDNRNLAVMVAIDKSGSMSGKPMKDCKKAASYFVNLLSADDSICVVAFDDQIRVVHPLDLDKQNALEAISKLKAGRDTALFDATHKCLELLQPSQDKKAVVVFTDGRNDLRGKSQAQHKVIKDVVEKAKENSIPIYTLAYGSNIDTTALFEMAQVSGGKYRIPKSDADLQDLYNELSHKPVSNYQVLYSSPSREIGVWHKLKVQINRNNNLYKIELPYFATKTRSFGIEKAAKGGKGFLPASLGLNSILIIVNTVLLIVTIAILIFVLMRRSRQKRHMDL